MNQTFTLDGSVSVNFINVLRAALMHTDAERAKKTVKSSVFFVLLGSAQVKAVCRTLMKLTPLRYRYFTDLV